MTKRYYTALTALATLTLTACTHTTSTIAPDPEATGYGTITIGSGISDETDIIAHIYALALEKAGYSVKIVDTGATRDDYLRAMGGQTTGADASASLATQEPSPSSDRPTNDPSTVDITPDYSGNLLLHLTQDGAVSPSDLEAAKNRSTMTPTAAPSDLAIPSASASTQVTAARTASANPLNVRGMSGNDIATALGKTLPIGLSTLNAASAENRDALVVTRATAEKYSLKTIGDLTKHCPDLVFGAPTVFQERVYGLPGLAENYKCKPARFTALDNQRELANQLASDTVQVADIFTSSAEIEDKAFVILEDNANNFIVQQLVPVIRTQELPQTAKDAINTISAQITTKDLIRLNRLTSGDDSIKHEDAAKFWFNKITE